MQQNPQGTPWLLGAFFFRINALFLLIKEQLFAIIIPAALERAFEMEMNILEETTKEKILELISKMDARELRLLLYFMKGMLAGKAAER